MKKHLVAGVIAAGLMVAGGTGFYLGHANDNSQAAQAGNRVGQMTQMMNAGNNQGFQPLVQKQGQDQDEVFQKMLPFMKKMHPNLSDKELKSLLESMHGGNGASCGVKPGNGNKANQQGTRGMMENRANNL